MLSVNLSLAAILPEINRCFDLFIFFIFFIYLQEEKEILKKALVRTYQGIVAFKV